MGKRMGRSGLAVLTGTLVTTGPIFGACSFGPTFDDWAATPGAVGAINLDEVLSAFQNSKSSADFERRVNEIYEGDGLVLVRVSKDGDRETLEGYEDLNKNLQIDVSGDDLLFSVIREQDTNRLQGHGSNGYYNRPFGGGGFLFGYIVASSLSRPGVVYETSRTSARTQSSQRQVYRSSSRYSSQLSKNTRYFSTKQGFAGSKYSGSRSNLSSARTSYMGGQKASGSFRTSGTSVRSGWGKAGSRGGGATGGGGFQMLIGGLKDRGHL